MASWLALNRRKANAARIQSIAVLPLENLSGDPLQEYFAAGMTDELINKLAQIKSLRVLSRTSTMQLKSTHKTLGEITRFLNTDAVVEGTVRREGNRIRINAELVDAWTDKQLWSQSYDREAGDALAVQNELALAIVKGIEITTRQRTRSTWLERKQLAQRLMTTI